MPKETKTGPEKGAGDHLVPPVGGVIVRMYDPGFGDCFLLSFRGEDDKPRHMLIDCGVHQSYEGGEKRIRAIAEDIRKTCNNTIDVVAISHEHDDHISGFSQAQDIFSTMEIKELWLAWTEDETDPVAIELKNKKELEKKALFTAIQTLSTAGNARVENLKNLWGFEARAAKGSNDNEESILNTLRFWSDKKPQRPEDYLVPGNVPHDIPGVRGVRYYVVGPPHSQKEVRKSDPEREMFFSPQMTDPERATIAAVLGMAGKGGSDGMQELRGYPFDPAFSIPLEKAGSACEGFFKEHYGFSDGDGQGASWRRIDTDWLENSMDQLALKIGSLTNNTSLVLAFELTDSGKILLFPGDAQIGSWLSWFRDPGKKGTEEWENHVDGERLLNHTVFYKVGHHGARNATPKQKGLPLMHKDLVAMIPVNQQWANDVVHWKHPDPRMLPELMKFARGRVLRSDRIPESDSMEMPEESNEREWKDFISQVDWDRGPDRLWIQYTVS